MGDYLFISTLKNLKYFEQYLEMLSKELHFLQS